MSICVQALADVAGMVVGIQETWLRLNDYIQFKC